MRATDLRERLSNGFQPFSLRLSDGRTIEVPHPDFIAVGQHFVIVVGRDNRARKIDVIHIVSIDDTPQPRRR